MKNDDQLIETGAYIDPLTDFGFKKLFGEEPNKELLLDFLNEIFKGRKVIQDLTYDKNEKKPPISNIRNMIYDLTCTDQDGEKFIIEIQRIDQKNFKERSLFYSAGLLYLQGERGEQWKYSSLKSVYFIGVMDFAFEDTTIEECLRRIILTDEKTGVQFNEKLEFVFIEIPRFNKTVDELVTGVDKWLFVLKNLSRLKKIPLILNSRVFKKLFDISIVAKLSKEEYMSYQSDLKAIRDERSILDAVKKEGMEIGKEQGIEIGKEEGIEIGKKQGEINIIQSMLKKGFHMEQIVELIPGSRKLVEEVIAAAK